jgi:hypothetical protein
LRTRLLLDRSMRAFSAQPPALGAASAFLWLRSLH